MLFFPRRYFCQELSRIKRSFLGRREAFQGEEKLSRTNRSFPWQREAFQSQEKLYRTKRSFLWQRETFQSQKKLCKAKRSFLGRREAFQDQKINYVVLLFCFRNRAKAGLQQRSWTLFFCRCKIRTETDKENFCVQSTCYSCHCTAITHQRVSLGSSCVSEASSRQNRMYASQLYHRFLKCTQIQSDSYTFFFFFWNAGS